jgi:predicted  nucleic acid-binding Zn-ribbon protein
MQQIPMALKFVFLSGCIMFCVIFSNRKNPLEHLVRLNDSLQSELESRDKVIQSLTAAISFVDSLETNFSSTAPLDASKPHDILTKLRNIDRGVKDTHQRIARAERELSVFRHQENGYVMMVDALKGEIGIRVNEIEVLEDSVEVYEDINVDLFENVQLHQNAITSLYNELTERESKLAALEHKVHQLLQSTEAEVWYTRAQGIELQASKIKLAPVKRKETYREALELYKKSMALGKKEASFKIASIQGILSNSTPLLASDGRNDSSW